MIVQYRHSGFDVTILMHIYTCIYVYIGVGTESSDIIICCFPSLALHLVEGGESRVI